VHISIPIGADRLAESATNQCFPAVTRGRADYPGRWIIKDAMNQCLKMLGRRASCATSSSIVAAVGDRHHDTTATMPIKRPTSEGYNQSSQRSGRGTSSD